METKFWLSIMLFISRIGIIDAAGQCHLAEYSIGGLFLRGHTFKTYQVGLPEDCYCRCFQELICQSFNFVLGQNLCELNKHTKEARPEDFVPDWKRFYVKRVTKRGSRKSANLKGPGSNARYSICWSFSPNDYESADKQEGQRCEPPHLSHVEIISLGTIRELPAESCSEIAASEGNKMVNRKYWTYSDGHSEVIEAYCEDDWQKINGKEPVFFRTKDNEYGAFNMTKSGRVKTMKLVHRSGSVRCNPSTGGSYWGFTNKFLYHDKLTTIITDDNKNAILPPLKKLEGLKPGGSYPRGAKQHFYSLDGNSLKSPELVFRNLTNPFSVSLSQEMLIWYGQDWKDCSENENKGKTCVDVYVWYE
ncbi:hypothetical protein AWC38_SpisGene22858 [Stylophora pistillata]|uniref:Apple domain-containing protein n=1 Tax=Stylophora pistillata TaxID=50429 RepID=A0A2B4R7E0_STYPI|nr:hypothetical protein AWC38_SpisGene22858 [Stylophora pistillata]